MLQHHAQHRRASVGLSLSSNAPLEYLDAEILLSVGALALGGYVGSFYGTLPMFGLALAGPLLVWTVGNMIWDKDGKRRA
jgi:hypothetical protein